MLKALLTNKYLYIIIFSLAGIGAISLFTLDKFVMPYYTKYNEGVTVPDVTRVSRKPKEMLSNIGLQFEVADRRAILPFQPIM